MEKRKPGIDRALQWLQTLLKDSRLKPGDSLPSVRQLSQDSQVCTGSMSKAIQLLKQSGAITGGPRCRSVVVANGNALAFGSAQQPRRKMRLSPVARIESELHRAILVGEIGPGMPFPGSKELGHRFHASPATIRSALDRLYTEGLIETEKRWFCLRVARQPRANARIALIGFATAPHEPIIRAHQDTYLCSLLHAQVWQRNFLLDQVSFPPGPNAVLYGPDRARPYVFDENVIGCIVLLNQISDLWPDLFNKLVGLRIPIAVIDEFGHWSVGEHFHSPGRVRVFSFSTGRLAATEITRTLLRYGHRHFAFISPYPFAFWSGMRREAIQEELDKANIGDNLTVIESDIGEEVSRLFPSGSGKEVHRYAMETLKRFPPVVQGAYARNNNAGSWSMHITSEAVDRLLQVRLEPLYRRPEITAWIAVNDQCAAIASQGLRDNGRHMPADLSLASFDNTPAAQDLRIASYDFNASGCVSAVLNFLTSSIDSRKTFPTERIEIPGTLVERASLGPARR